jgi:hypothetical protein
MPTSHKRTQDFELSVDREPHTFIGPSNTSPIKRPYGTGGDHYMLDFTTQFQCPYIRLQFSCIGIGIADPQILRPTFAKFDLLRKTNDHLFLCLLFPRVCHVCAIPAILLLQETR